VFPQVVAMAEAEPSGEMQEDACGIAENARCSYSYSPCPSCGVVTSLSGKLEVRRRNGTMWCDAIEGTAFGRGDTLRLCNKPGEQGKCRIVYYNAGITLDCFTDTQFQAVTIDLKPLPGAQRKTAIDLSRGKVHYLVERSSNAVDIAVNGASLSVPGAEFIAERKDGEIEIRVIFGRIEFTPEGGNKPLEFIAGETARFPVSGGNPSEKAKFDPGTEEMWWESLKQSFPES
jgi:hypothetical protein